MYYTVKFKYIAIILITAVLVSVFVTLKPHIDRKEMIREEAEFKKSQPVPQEQPKSEPENIDYIKWVDFDVSKTAMDYAYKYDVSS
ncbi:MAG: hypothetical protein J6V58_06285, partial [Clostridia bacterium]|nr:hypothetical protein [Clostridia bacterium]